MSGGLRHFVSATPQRPNAVKLRKFLLVYKKVHGILALIHYHTKRRCHEDVRDSL